MYFHYLFSKRKSESKPLHIMYILMADSEISLKHLIMERWRNSRTIIRNMKFYPITISNNFQHHFRRCIGIFECIVNQVSNCNGQQPAITFNWSHILWN